MKPGSRRASAPWAQCRGVMRRAAGMAVAVGVAAVVAIAVSAGSFAQAAPPVLEQIAAERAATEARFVDRERECRARFVVTDCLDTARQERRATLNRLKRSEIEFDEARRRETAAARRSDADARIVEQQRRAAAADAAAATAGRAEPEPTRLQRGEPEADPRLLPRVGSKRRAADDSGATERANVAKFEARQRAAQARRETVERRNALKEKQGNRPKPLPLPASAPQTRKP